ncbi:MAG TPA: cytochrome c biogenesis CcdA family protein [Burkholderiales bacterium]|nr:cytochrome c biogenesis CcdA family protein [Burkholderiales bacterium]
MGSVSLALIAGMLTTLSPCVLPILPIVLVGAVGQHRYGPLALMGGLVFSFTTVGLLVSGALRAFDVAPDSIRTASAVLLLLVGLILLSTLLQKRFAMLSAPLSNALNDIAGRIGPAGLRGQFLSGALLGAIWTPCSGPTLGAALTLAASSETVLRAAAVVLAFGFGAGTPLLALAYGSRETMKARRTLLVEVGRIANPAFGALLVSMAALTLLGYDRRIEAALVDAMPDWLLALTTRF